MDIPAQVDPRVARYARARWSVVLLFALGCMLTLTYNGAFFDEGIYITAGIRTLEGHGRADGYLTWFAGSLLWPVLAGIGYQLGGLVGTRVIAVLLGTVTLTAVGLAATNLFDAKAGFWTTLAFAVNGPFVAVARQGVYDGAALMGIAVAFWAITELARRDHRGWLLLVAAAYAFAVFSKYPTGLMILPLVILLLHLRSERGLTDVPMLAFVGGAMGLAVFVPLRDQIGVFFDWRLQNRPGFGVPVSVIIFAIVYLSALPAALALVGWLLSRDQRKVATILIACLGIWPIYHILAQDPVGTNKHLVLGYLFAYPLIGVTLARLWSSQRGTILLRTSALIVTAGLAAAGFVQITQADQSFPNLTWPANYLAARVSPGDTLLINESWPITKVLYTERRIRTPWDVYDTYRVLTEPTAPDICDYDWVVDVQGSYRWPAEIQQALEACTGYTRVYSHVSTIVNPGTDFAYIRYPVETVIWQATSQRPAEASEPPAAQAITEAP
jgi:hypothetical protein